MGLLARMRTRHFLLGPRRFSGVKFRTHLSRYTTFNLFWKAWLHHNIPPHDPECKLPAYWASSPFRPLKADRVRYWHLELDAGIWLVLQRLRLRLPQARGRFAKMFLLRRNVLFFGAWKYPANSSAITLLVLYLLSIVTNMNISFLLGFNDLVGHFILISNNNIDNFFLEYRTYLSDP